MRSVRTDFAPHAFAFFLLAVGGCSASTPPKPTDPQSLAMTLQGLAGFGNKHVGSAEGRQAGEYVMARMQKLGLANVHMESFQFPAWQLDGASLSTTVNGAAFTPGFDVFEGSGPGHADGDVVYAGTAHPSEVAPLDLHGKVALVDRDASYHRSAQYTNVAAAGATAMLYTSIAADNLRQVGSVRFDGWTALGPIPAVTIGADDGKMLHDALTAGQPVHAVVDVAASSHAASGVNVLGSITGSDARGVIVLGAHYDTWFTGSCDNGGGIATLLAVAARRLAEGKPRYTLVFVAYDGEEVALYGGYDFLRRHRIVAKEPILAVLNFEMPSATQASIVGLAHSNHAALDEALQGALLPSDYPFYATMEVVPKLFGGVIPTDIQGIYRNGVPTASTATDSPFYHTTADTPDKVDTVMLARAVDDFDQALTLLMKDEPSQLSGIDDKLWQATVTVMAAQPTDPLVVRALVSDAEGRPQANAPVNAVFLVDDFFPVATMDVITDGSGLATFAFSATARMLGAGNRFVHVVAGPQYPLVEQIVTVP
jgi:Zn-dependent M28 family amino/carboxypeptidase